jgi:hypothetical protein
MGHEKRLFMAIESPKNGVPSSLNPVISPAPIAVGLQARFAGQR